MPRDLRFDIRYPYPPALVWEALTDPKAIREWLMENDFEARVGHRFRFRTKPAPGFDGIVHCEVLEVDPPRRLRYSWRGGPIDTMVTFTLAPDGDGTRLQLDHTGFRGAHALLVSFILGSGWKGGILKRSLPRVLEIRASALSPRPAR
jgi:uncharacterized protein YndB with AHSA1/START domain